MTLTGDAAPDPNDVAAALPTDLAAAAVQMMRRLPRPVDHRQVAGFLAVCRAHPQAQSALDYAGRKEEQASRAEQRVEQQFWGQVRELLGKLGLSDQGGSAAASEGGRAVALAQRLAAENLLRQTLAAEAGRVPAVRRGPPAHRQAPRPTGDARD